MWNLASELCLTGSLLIFLTLLMLLAIWNSADYASLLCPFIVALKCLPGLEEIQGNQIFGQICVVLSGSLAATARVRGGGRRCMVLMA